MNSTSFKIYNASAGSGKTFTLVKEYLKILVAAKTNDAFKHVLAITFTNKAVAEMKDRILEMLKQFSSEITLQNPNNMFQVICEELSITPELLHKKSKSILKSIINNYASFDISTIDGFTHRIIRTFAHDLKLPINFEVELDQDTLLNEAVDSLIAKAGTDKDLTTVLVDFAIEKADDDKSWDIAFDFNKIAKLLINENDIPFIDALQTKTLVDFETLKTSLVKKISATESEIVEAATSVLTLIKESGLQTEDFLRGSLPRYFENLANKKFAIAFDSKWQADLIDGGNLYPSRITEHVASTIDSIQPQIASAFTETKTAVFHLKFLKAFYKNITPLSVLNMIQKELSKLKAEQNKMLISEFNALISNNIKNQPTPFIYERLGEKFRHYFIDEFQDTSAMQWENLIPLIDNAMASENGSTLIVGDAKQAIYRWRGGKATQFIQLYNNLSSPFQIRQEVLSLDYNYRSFREIVTFNNGFFKYLSESTFVSENYRNLYDIGSNQITNLEENGYVNIVFLDIPREIDPNTVYPQKVHETIIKCLSNGFALSDICVLTRKKKEGVAIADYLSASNIKIVSSETLLLQRSAKVQFINNFLKLLLQPGDNETKVLILEYLTETNNIADKHLYLQQHINLNLSQLFDSFMELGISLNANKLLQLPLYDLAETVVRGFQLNKNSDAYIQFYLDFVLEYSQKQAASLSDFLTHFDKKKDSLSIVSPKGQDAVQIMTIHKAKGLEFPIVIFPYADLNIYAEREPKVWYPLDAKEYNGFSSTLINYSKDFEHYDNIGKAIYYEHESELELDNINLLYVSLTRPIEQLYIISKKDINSKNVANPKTYAGLLINYLQQKDLWNDKVLEYEFGNSNRESVPKHAIEKSFVLNTFISNPKEAHNINIVTKSGLLWDTSQQDAIEKGNLIHDLMSVIETSNDIDFVIAEYLQASIINQEQADELTSVVKQIVIHPKLSNYFKTELIVYNERDIISKTGMVLRPDRLVINDKNIVIIDYKSGVENRNHEQQLQLYQDVLEEMNYIIDKKILVYINKRIMVKEI